MADIFISYSSRDRLQAKQLHEILAAAGLSVWIDQSGIDFATSWSGEIVDAIEACSAFIVLLSRNSVASENVAKEVILAAELKKKLLPLDLEPVELPKELRYHLAGIQRAPITDTEALQKALGNLGITTTGVVKRDAAKAADSRTSLIILPFEDLSPAQDNQWFADGLAGELIDALSHIKSLRILDRKSSRDLRGVQQSTAEIGKLFNTRYFIEGTVRKFADEIKISVSLIDIVGGDILWQQAHRGEFKDIFDIQEKVAAKVVEGLKLHLTPSEASHLAERGTENPEAYELLVKAAEYFQRQTKETLQLALQLLTEAIGLDPKYARAYQLKARTLNNIFRHYDPNPELLTAAEALCHEALRLKPDFFATYHPLSQIYTMQGKLDDAERTIREIIRIEPDFLSYFSLGLFYDTTDREQLAIEPYEESLRLNQDYLVTYWNLCAACMNARQTERCAKWASVALPKYERHRKLHPDDELYQVRYIIMLSWNGQQDFALKALRAMSNVRDPMTYYSIACLFGELGEKEEALRTFRKALEAGLRNKRLHEFLTDEDQGVPCLKGTPEYEEVRRMIEKIEQEWAA